MKFALSLILACVGLGMAAEVGLAEAVVFEQHQDNRFTQSYEGVDDVTLIDGQKFKGRNYGGANALWFGNSGSADKPTVRRSLLRFDLASMKGKYKAIEQAELTLYVVASLPEDLVVQAYAVLPDNAGWIEGDAKGTGNPTGLSSWSYRKNFDEAWAGGDGLGKPGEGYGEHALATVVARKAGQVTFTLPGKLIEQWIEAENAGILLRAEDESLPVGQARFWSSEAPEHQPQLTITYELNSQ